MCAKFVYLSLGGFFVFVVATVAAFVYLDWWQAVLVSLATFLALIYAAKQVVRSTFKNFRKLAEGMFTEKSRVLRGATVTVHSVNPAVMPEELREQTREVIDADRDADNEEGADDGTPDYENYRWCEVELTVFPDSTQTSTFQSWDVGDLRVVPLDAPKLEFLNAEQLDSPEFDLWNVRVVSDGAVAELDNDKLIGPRRLRFVVGVPRGVRLVKLQYFFEQFGRVELPPALGLPPAKPR